MAFQPYPRHVHGPNKTYKVVHSDAERDAAVADGWYLWPKDVPDADLGQAPAAQDADTGAAVIDDDAPPETLDALTVAQASELVAICDDVARLQAWQLAEAQGKGRKGLLAVLEDRLSSLAEA
jgi:hypothetical protein